MDRTLTFKAYTEFGKCDEEEWELDFDVTEEEYKLLKDNYDERTSVYSIEAIKDIIDKVTEVAIEQCTIDMIDSGMADEYIEELIDEGKIDSEEDWTADITFRVFVGWPYNL